MIRMHDRAIDFEEVYPLRYLLISHHPPEHLDRTWKLCVGGAHIRVCSRCSGIVFGVMFTLIADLVGALPHFSLSSIFLLSALLLTPSIVDFHFQLMEFRKSDNLRRITTGILFGIGLTLCTTNALSGNTICIFIPLCLLAFYFTMLGLSCKGREKLAEHITIYFDFFEKCYVVELRRKSLSYLSKKR